jgi:MFS transporter, DHA1 family, multidrug resistance protein
VLLTAADRRRIAVVCIVLSWIGPFSMDAYSPSFPALAADFGVSDRMVQLTLTATLVGMCLGQLVFGPLSDRVGRRRPLVWALVVYLGATVLCALAPSIWWLVAGRFVQGITASAGISIARAIGRDVHHGVALSRFYSWMGAVTAIAPIVGPLTGALLVEDAGWRWIFGMIAGLGAVALLGVLLLLPETRWSIEGADPVAGPPSETDPRAALDRTAVARLVVVCVVMAGTNGAVMAYLAGSSFLLQDGYGLTAAQYSHVFALNAVGIFLLSSLNTVLVRRWSSIALLTASVPVTLLVGIGLLVCGILGTGLAPVLVLFAVLIASLGIIAPNATALAMEGSRDHAGLVSGFLGVAAFLAGALVAPLVGGASTEGVPAMFIAIVGCAGTAAVVLLAGRATALRTRPPVPVAREGVLAG